jgi:serine/threonine protein kinase
MRDLAATAAYDAAAPSPRGRPSGGYTGQGASGAVWERPPGVPGSLLRGRYLPEDKIAVGGMGEVWRARDIRLGRIVAVKLLRPEFADSPEFRDRLRLEGRHAALLSHPGVVAVHDFDDGSDGGVPFLVMEYVPGPSLAAVLSVQGTLSPGRVLGLIVQAAEALACAHGAGIVHRDVKPGNVLIDGGRVKIADFGIARAAGAVAVTRAGLVMGTPAYLSPEQVGGLPATPASDLYGLGVIAYECLTGRPPFGGTALAIARAHRDRPMPPLPATVPVPVAELVAALTAKDPRYRPGDALAVAEWARRAGHDPQVAAAAAGPARNRPPAPAEPAGRATITLARRLPPQRLPRRRLPGGVAATVLILLLLAGCAGWTAQHLFGDPPAAVSVIAPADVTGPGWTAIGP